MILVPMLVGVAVLVVAISSRNDVRNADVPMPDLRLTFRDAAPGRSSDNEVPGRLSRADAGEIAGRSRHRQVGGRRRSGYQPAANPLAEAFPQLRLWVPEQDAIFQATHRMEGAAGPDIILRGRSDAA